MFVTAGRTARVNLSVVALGTPDRLFRCLDALVAHESREDFTVTVVVNAATPSVAPPARPFPDGVLVEYAAGNLGWAGGLHRARSRTDAELLVWVQEDMTPEPGWLDALVAAADQHPGAAAFGAVRVGEGGEVLTHNAGTASPAGDVARWNLTDRTTEHLPSEVTTYDWVTSKGMLTRAAVFDEVGGPDPRLFPLNHVDKDYCTHLRCHGWDVALVPAARLRHEGGQASPSAFRIFVAEWRDPWFDARWAEPVARLAGATSGRVEHPCADWRAVRCDQVEAVVGLEATRMLVPFARFRAREEAAALARQAADHADALGQAKRYAEEVVALFEQADARVQALLASRRRQRRKVRRLRRQRDEALAALQMLESRRLTSRVRATLGTLRSGRSA